MGMGRGRASDGRGGEGVMETFGFSRDLAYRSSSVSGPNWTGLILSLCILLAFEQSEEKRRVS